MSAQHNSSNGAERQNVQTDRRTYVWSRRRECSLCTSSARDPSSLCECTATPTTTTGTPATATQQHSQPPEQHRRADSATTRRTERGRTPSTPHHTADQPQEQHTKQSRAEPT